MATRTGPGLLCEAIGLLNDADRMHRQFPGSHLELRPKRPRRLRESKSDRLLARNPLARSHGKRQTILVR